MADVSEFVLHDAVAKFNYKTREQKRDGGVLENWTLHKREGLDDSVWFYMTAKIEADEYWGDRPYLHTSSIVSIDMEAGIVETLNTFYKLGAPVPSGAIKE
jgi:hypothetical protein